MLSLLQTTLPLLWTRVAGEGRPSLSGVARAPAQSEGSSSHLTLRFNPGGQELGAGSNSDRTTGGQRDEESLGSPAIGSEPHRGGQLITEAPSSHRKHSWAFWGPWPCSLCLLCWNENKQGSGQMFPSARYRRRCPSAPACPSAWRPFPSKTPQPPSVPERSSGLAGVGSTGLASAVCGGRAVWPGEHSGTQLEPSVLLFNWGLIFLYTKVMGLEETTTAWGLRPDKSRRLCSGLTSRPRSPCTPAGRGASRPGRLRR